MLKHILLDINYLSGKFCSFGGGRGRGLQNQKYNFKVNNKYNFIWNGSGDGRYTVCIKKQLFEAGIKKYKVTIIEQPDDDSNTYNPVSEFTIRESDIEDSTESLGECDTLTYPSHKKQRTGGAGPNQTLPSSRRAKTYKPSSRGKKKLSKKPKIGGAGPDSAPSTSKIEGIYASAKIIDFTNLPPIGTRVIDPDGWYTGTIINNTFVEIVKDDSGNPTGKQLPNITIYWDFRIEFAVEKPKLDKYVKESHCVVNTNLVDCKKDITCEWVGNKCKRKRRKRPKAEGGKAQDDLNETECTGRGIKFYTETPNIKETYTFIIPNTDSNISIYLEILSLLDALKDFCGDKNPDITDEHKQKQTEIINNQINEILKKIDKDDPVKKLLLPRGRLENIYDELEKKLGIIVLFPFTIIKILFPGIEQTAFDKDTYSFISFLTHFLNNSLSISQLKIISDKYKEHYKTNQSVAKKWVIDEVRDWVDINHPKTIAWIEATPGSQKIDAIIRRLRDININKNLLSFISPATKLDAATETNEITNILGSITYPEELEIGQIHEIKLVDNTGNEIINWRIERINDIVVGEPNYLLHVDKFYTLDCKKFGGLKVINTKLSIPNVWKTIEERLFENGVNPYDDKDDLFIEADLCMKANKTSMDMLKGIYAMIELEKQSSRLQSDIDMISIFNDQNAARFFASISGNGVTIYASKVPTAPEKTPTRFIIKRNIIDFLKSDTSVLPALPALPALPVQSATLSDPDPDDITTIASLSGGSGSVSGTQDDDMGVSSGIPKNVLNIEEFKPLWYNYNNGKQEGLNNYFKHLFLGNWQDKIRYFLQLIDDVTNRFRDIYRDTHYDEDVYKDAIFYNAFNEFARSNQFGKKIKKKQSKIDKDINYLINLKK
jgi:hypothetical protein